MLQPAHHLLRADAATTVASCGRACRDGLQGLGVVAGNLLLHVGNQACIVARGFQIGQLLANGEARDTGNALKKVRERSLAEPIIREQ
jgi:hypothetical protein